jgi:glycosyltransferase involved in cell wall biosynthesis
MEKARSKPLVSVVIPTKNSGNTLEQCLASILRQTYKNLEVIIVDTKSTDNTLDITAKINCKIVSTDWGLLGARYQGCKVVSGYYVVLLDSDQFLEDSLIERCVLLAEKYDMLFLEEMSYQGKTFVEKLYEADRRLIQKEFEAQQNPLHGAIAPRFYRQDILRKAFSHIPEQVLPFAVAREDAIIYYEAWKISNKVATIPNALWHVEARSLVEVWKKNFFYGRSSKKLLESGYYEELVRKKIRFRKTEVKISKDKLLSLFLSLLKGPPYFLGLYL